MTTPHVHPVRFPSVSRPRRAARPVALLTAAALGLAVLAGCSSQGSSTDCGLDACSVTFDRGVQAEASVLGVRARLVGADGDRVTVEVAGEQLSLTVGEQAVQAGGLYVTLQSVSQEQVVVRIGRNPGS